MALPVDTPPVVPSSSDSRSDLIDTAIVIKNIPFGYPEDDFLNKLLPELGLVLPYAFNYHRNRTDGAFRGLAFANFTHPHEAQAAVDVLNNYELEGRRLRVELKKRLSAEEEQRKRLARQSRRSVAPQMQFLSGTPLAGESIHLGGDFLDPQFKPRLVPREATSPTVPAGMNTVSIY